MSTPEPPTTPPGPPPTVEEQVAALRADVGQLAAAFEALRGSMPPPVVSWLDLPAEVDPAELLADLAAWVDQVWNAWPDGRPPRCWPRHPDMVEDLLALQSTWIGHTRRGSRGWPDRKDWLLRDRPAAARRFTEARRDGHQTCVEPAEPTSPDVIEAALDARPQPAKPPVTP